ncbi:hypothetical protein M8J77_023716 [Diaphorina citri]|nr:hypothetical protein M8J77_023716 [Diaphorina citri]
MPDETRAFKCKRNADDANIYAVLDRLKMSKKNIARFTQLLKKDHFNFDIVKGKSRGQIIFSIDVTDESHNRADLRKLVHTLKTNLNRHQTEQVRERIMQNESSVLVNELIECYDKSGKNEDNEEGDEVSSSHDGDEKIEKSTQKKKRDSTEALRKLEQKLKENENKRFEKEKKKEIKILEKEIKKEEKMRVKEEIERVKSESKSRQAAKKLKLEASNGPVCKTEEEYEELKNLYEQVKNKLERLEKDLKSKRKHSKTDDSDDVSDDTSSDSEPNKRVHEKNSRKPQGKVSFNESLRKDKKTRKPGNNTQMKKNTRDSSSRNSSKARDTKKDNRKSDKSAKKKTNTSRDSSSRNTSKSRGDKRHDSPKKVKKIKTKKEKSKEDKLEEKKKPKKKQKKLKVNYALLPGEQSTAFNRSKREKSKRFCITICDSESNSRGKIATKNAIVETSKFDIVSLLANEPKYPTIFSDLDLKQTETRGAENLNSSKEKKYSSDKVVCSESLQTFNSKLC